MSKLTFIYKRNTYILCCALLKAPHFKLIVEDEQGRRQRVLLEGESFELDIAEYERGHWAVFVNEANSRDHVGYFHVLNGQDKEQPPAIEAAHFTTEHLRVLMALHRRTSKMVMRQYIDVTIDGRTYTLKYHSCDKKSHCHALCVSILVNGKNMMFNFIYIPSAANMPDWMWYDDAKRTFVDYVDDDLLRLQMEASYQANLQFPMTNKLFRKEHNESIFSCCYLSRLSSLCDILPDWRYHFEGMVW